LATQGLDEIPTNKKNQQCHVKINRALDQPLGSKTRFLHKKYDGKLDGLELSLLGQYFRLEPVF
jgi:hypothetical protein